VGQTLQVLQKSLLQIYLRSNYATTNNRIQLLDSLLKHWKPQRCVLRIGNGNNLPNIIMYNCGIKYYWLMEWYAAVMIQIQ